MRRVFVLSILGLLAAPLASADPAPEAPKSEPQKKPKVGKRPAPKEDTREGTEQEISAPDDRVGTHQEAPPTSPRRGTHMERRGEEAAPEPEPPRRGREAKPAEREGKEAEPAPKPQRRGREAKPERIGEEKRTDGKSVRPTHGEPPTP